MLTIFEFKDIKKPLGKFKIHQLPNGKFYAHTKFSWLGRKFFISRMDFGVLYNHYCLRDYEIIEYDHHFNLVLFDTKESLISKVDGVEMVVVGHTPDTHIRQLGNVFFIDTGCVFGERYYLFVGEIDDIISSTKKSMNL